MWQYTSTIHEYLVANGNIVTKDSDIFQARPFSDDAIPTNDARFDMSVVLDLGVAEQNASLQTNAVTNNGIFPNGNVGTDTTILSYDSGGMDQNVSSIEVWFVRLTEVGRFLSGKRGEIETGTSEEILGLANIHPEAF